MNRRYAGAAVAVANPRRAPTNAKSMKKVVLSLGGFVLLSGAAHAAVMETGSNTSLTGNQPGTSIVENFDTITTITPSPANFTDGSLTFSGDGAIVIGSVSDAYAEPYTDTTYYLTTGYDGTPGTKTETVTFAQNEWRFGLFWGSMDAYNTLEFFNGSNLVGSFTGNDVTVPPDGADGDQSSFSTDRYVNFYGEYNKVIFQTTSPAFEVDNISTGVPETSTWVMMLAGFGGLGFAAFRRSRKTPIAIA
jgi:hypothetical protein